MIDDGKTLFDFMPGRPAEDAEEDPFEKPGAGEQDLELRDAVLDAMREVYDPEIPVNLVDLGLIYELSAGRDGKIFVEMTLTAPSCPVAGSLPGEVEKAIRTVPGVTDAHVKLVWTPPWHQDLMTEAAKLELGLL